MVEFESGWLFLKWYLSVSKLESEILLAYLKLIAFQYRGPEKCGGNWKQKDYELVQWLMEDDKNYSRWEGSYLDDSNVNANGNSSSFPGNVTAFGVLLIIVSRRDL